VGVRVDLRGAPQTDARIRSRRALLASVSLAVLVVVAAGIAGKAHFGGLRWVPRLHIKLHKQQARPLHAPPLARLPRANAPHAAGRFPFGTVLLWIIVGIVALAVAYLIWRWWAGRPSRAARSQHSVPVAATSEVPVVVPEPEPEPDVPALRTGIELALQLLDEQREPADAVVRAWLGLQESAQESGIVRAPAETPTEFTSRILSRAFADDRAIRTLLRLYLRTRFGDHPVSADDVAAVRGALKELVRTWPAPESAVGAAAGPGAGAGAGRR
jgi:hypothetical protein